MEEAEKAQNESILLSALKFGAFAGMSFQLATHSLFKDGQRWTMISQILR